MAKPDYTDSSTRGNTRTYKRKDCAQCGATYRPASAPQKFCSIDCRIKHNRGRWLKNERAKRPDLLWRFKRCITCGGKFAVVVAPGSAKQVYCKAACNPAHQRVDYDPVPCANCGEEFKPVEQRHKFCSRECQNRERWRRSHKDRRCDPAYRLHRAIRSRMWYCLKDVAGRKRRESWESLVGYTIEQLIEHLESQFDEGMSWDNYGEWHVDHVIPLSHFNITSLRCKDFKKAWALENLQPLWAEENISKNNRFRLERQAA